MAIVAAAATRAKIPFWGFVLSCGANDFQPTLPHMRLEAFTNLAFGAQGIQYFTYWTAFDASCRLYNAPILTDGTRGPAYAMVKQLNEEIARLSPVFVDSKMLDIGHTATGALAGIQQYKARPPVNALKADGRGALVALHAKGKREFLVVVNRDVDKDLALSVTFDGKRKVSLMDEQGAFQPIEGKASSRGVGPGDVAVYSWECR
jgi:hypothetical protein